MKMSKSYGNTIDIFTDKATLKSRVMGIVTDSRPVDEPKDPDHDNLFALYRLFATPAEVEEMRAKYPAPGLEYVSVKKAVHLRLLEVRLDTSIVLACLGIALLVQLKIAMFRRGIKHIRRPFSRSMKTLSEKYPTM